MMKMKPRYIVTSSDNKGTRKMFEKTLLHLLCLMWMVLFISSLINFCEHITIVIIDYIYKNFGHTTRKRSKVCSKLITTVPF